MDGVLPVDKPVGPTSHDVVAIARRGLGMRRIGHTGTLDPFASGLLLLCVGASTRLAEYLTGLDKVYEATVRLGRATDTHDRTGAVTEEDTRWEELGVEEVRAAAGGLTGALLQVPPQFSAKKVGGEAMYRKARRGERVELEPAAVTVHALEVRSFAPPLVELRVVCSSGTYIRALARDLGRSLGTGAHLLELRRTRIGRFDVADALTPDELSDRTTIAEALIPPEGAVAHLPPVHLDRDAADRLANGRTVEVAEAAWPAGSSGGGPVAVFADGALVAIGVRAAPGLRPVKVFAAPRQGAARDA